MDRDEAAAALGQAELPQFKFSAEAKALPFWKSGAASVAAVQFEKRTFDWLEEVTRGGAPAGTTRIYDWEIRKDLPWRMLEEVQNSGGGGKVFQATFDGKTFYAVNFGGMGRLYDTKGMVLATHSMSMFGWITTKP